LTERELKKKLESAGWVITHGTGHDMAKHPDQPGIKIPIPRHTGGYPHRHREEHPEGSGDQVNARIY